MSFKPQRNYILITTACALLGGAAWSQTMQTVPPDGLIPVSPLDSLPHRDISNGIVSAKVYLPGEGGFYRGTRFDRTGVVAHGTFKGDDFGEPWFSSYSPHVRDFVWKNGQVTVSTVSAAAGPAEDFSPSGY